MQILVFFKSRAISGAVVIIWILDLLFHLARRVVLCLEIIYMTINMNLTLMMEGLSHGW